MLGALSRIRHALSAEVHGFFDREGFYWVNTPIITASDCEGAGDRFRGGQLTTFIRARRISLIRIFSAAKPSSRSAVSSTSKVTPVPWVRFTPLGQPFRAENSNTSRHLAEFWMIEPEVAFADLAANADLAEQFLSSVIWRVLNRCPDDMAFFDERSEDS